MKKYENNVKYTLQSVLVFGPESVSYERSRGIRRWVFREISARVFLGKIPKSQDSIIYTIFRFFELTRPARPPARPSVRPGTQNISPDTQNISPDTQNISPYTHNISSGTHNISSETKNVSSDT